MKLLWRITPRALSSPVNSSIQQFDLFLPWPFHPAEKCLLLEWKKTRRLRRRSLNSTFITVHKAGSWIKSCHEVGLISPSNLSDDVRKRLNLVCMANCCCHASRFGTSWAYETPTLKVIQERLIKFKASIWENCLLIWSWKLSISFKIRRKAKSRNFWLFVHGSIGEACNSSDVKSKIASKFLRTELLLHRIYL